jgi:hypothetical protein
MRTIYSAGFRSGGLPRKALGVDFFIAFIRISNFIKLISNNLVNESAFGKHSIKMGLFRRILVVSVESGFGVPQSAMQFIRLMNVVQARILVRRVSL